MDDLKDLANALIERAKRADLGIITAESCTAGLMCQVLADAEGASLYFHGGFVTYTKPHKRCALGVPEGPAFGELQRGSAVTIPDGTVVQPGAVVGASRRGRTGSSTSRSGSGSDSLRSWDGFVTISLATPAWSMSATAPSRRS